MSKITFYPTKLLFIITMLFHHLCTLDTRPGAIDHLFYNDETLMAMFIGGIDEKSRKPFHSNKGKYHSIREWKGLTFDNHQNLIEIDFTLQVAGSLAFAFVPRSVKKIVVVGCGLTGTIDAELLPDGLEHFDAAEANMHGSIHFPGLPSHLMHFDVSESNFSGSADLRNLPPNLIKLMLSANLFSGKISLNTLPKKMKELSLANNRFYGGVSVAHLPESMEDFSISDCDFCGPLKLNRLPPNLKYFSVSHNKFTGSVSIVQDFNTNKLEGIDLSHNCFSGVAKIDPEIFESVIVRGNRITRVVDDGDVPYYCDVDAKLFVTKICEIGCVDSGEDEASMYWSKW